MTIDDQKVKDELLSFGLPFKPCGLNADWSTSAWHLATGQPNVTSGDHYLIDTEIFNGEGQLLFQVVEADRLGTIAGPSPLRSCLAEYVRGQIKTWGRVTGSSVNPAIDNGLPDRATIRTNELLNTFCAFVDAAVKLTSVWGDTFDSNDNDTPKVSDALTNAYPSFLPSFDEFVSRLIDVRREVLNELKKQGLKECSITLLFKSNAANVGELGAIGDDLGEALKCWVAERYADYGKGEVLAGIQIENLRSAEWIKD